MPQLLAGGAIAQGSVFSIFGANLGPAAGAQQPSYPLSTTLGGVTVIVSQGSTSVNAVPIYVSSSVINAIMPSTAPLGRNVVRVKVGNSPLSNPMTVVVGATAFGIYTANGTGIGPGILQNFNSATDQPINSARGAAKPGQPIVLWGTGLGPVASDTATPPIGNLPTKAEVIVGGVSASIQYSGRTPCCAGIDQIVFTVPSNAPQGCWVPVYVRTAGSVISNVVTMAITQDGSSCLLSSATPPFVTAGNYGAFLTLRAATHEDIGTRSIVDVTGDYTAALAYQVGNSAFPFHPVFSLPPDGTCTAYATKGDILRGDTLPGAVPGGKALDFGAGFSLTGPGGAKLLQNILVESPLRYLGGSITGNLFSNTLYLQPGSYQIGGTGGKDIGSFSASGTMPSAITWTNRDQTVNVDRGQPLTLTWTGAGLNDRIVIAGFGVDLPNDSTSMFGCVAPKGATSFTVPAAMLANLPPTRPNPLQSKSVIYVTDLSTSGSSVFTPPGLDMGVAMFLYATGKTVVFR